ncbi:MAG: CPBP family intramembrane glutamic endopeptidase [Romboutsia sp.]|uniref:CPBP family intramembrane glutamic endopeptidase n=1 Tax=Romboutsia sp. TaxID=1965302 RepID=UPI003F30CBC4
MSTDINNIKQEIKYFLLINLGIIAFVSIFIFMSASKPDSDMIIANFAGLFMYVPAFSVVVVLKKISKYEFTTKVDKFMRFFAITTIVRIVVSVVESLIFNSIVISSLIDTVVSIYLLCVVIYNREEFEAIDLSISKNFKKTLGVVSIFLVITIVRSVVSFMLEDIGTVDISNGILLAIMSMVMNFFLGFNLFFGEEFGWRYFLQPRLQKVYGKKCGVFILGFIWGIWHLPLCFTLYSPETPIYCVISHIGYCMLLGVFLGYAYMKTENIWAPILIHLVNNSMAVVLGGGYESVITLETLILGIVINAIVFLPFLLTKEYKSNNIKEGAI